MTTPVKVAISGAAGRVAYPLMFRIAGGDLLGQGVPVELRLLDLTPNLGELEGRVMELHDSAFGDLADAEIGDDAKTVFDGADVVLLVGGKPRGKGQSRSDLARDNGAIFAAQAAALNDVAAADVKVLVTGNPSNTNCAIAAAHAPDIPRQRFSALMRLDHDRARHRLAKHLHVNVRDVTHVSVWGNHSPTMYADVFHAQVKGESAWPLIDDMDWLTGHYIPGVANRGAEIIRKRGASSVASAANATLDAMRDWLRGTDWTSMAVASDDSYGVPPGLYCSMPVTVDTSGQYHIVQGIDHGQFCLDRIRASVEELIAEREQAHRLGLL